MSTLDNFKSNQENIMFDFIENQQFASFISLAIPDQDKDEEKDDDEEKLPPAGDG